MNIEEMRKLMEISESLDKPTVITENFVTEPDAFNFYGAPDDPFHDANPPQPMLVRANVPLPKLYMNAGDTLYLEPTNNVAEVYSEENGLTYDWDAISHMLQMGQLDIITDQQSDDYESYDDRNLYGK